MRHHAASPCSLSRQVESADAAPQLVACSSHANGDRGLAKIAIREAFKLSFEPARDRAKNNVSALVLWTWEWPAHYWMIQNRQYPNRVPPQAMTVNCKGSGPSKAIRDCSKPAVGKAVTLPWIDKP